METINTLFGEICIAQSRELVGEDSPNYKLLASGKNSLSDPELLSIIINGNVNKTEQIDKCRDLLKSVDYNLRQLAKLTYSDLIGLGLTKTQAQRLMVSFTFGSRFAESEVMAIDKITNSNDVFNIAKGLYCNGTQPYESFYILLLNKACKVIKKVCISEGGVSGTVVDPKKVFKIALDAHASSLILIHNHPSGNIQPSDADQRITKRIKDCGMLFDMPVLDHVIIGEDKYYSFADEGVI